MRILSLKKMKTPKKPRRIKKPKFPEFEDRPSVDRELLIWFEYFNHKDREKLLKWFIAMDKYLLQKEQK